MVFHGLTGGATQRLLLRDFGSVLARSSANPVASIEHAGHIVRYLSDYSAVVATRHGREVETSTAPLRVRAGNGGKLPVDLRLQAGPGGFAPVRPLAAVSMAPHSGGGVTVGPNGLRITLLGADVAGSMIGEQTAFYGGVGLDMDATVAPKLSGADLSVLLRSELSPRRIRYRLTLPVGASLKAKAGGAVVSRAGVTFARIPAPSARDAQGASVPVRMTVSGSELILAVASAKPTIAYPVLVDPEVVVPITEDGANWEWYYNADQSCEGNSPSGGGMSGCESPDKPYSHSGPGNGAPMTITMPPISLPFIGTQWNPYEEEIEDVFNNGGDAQIWWAPDGGEGITAIEFVGITSSGTINPEAEVVWSVGACKRFQAWGSEEAAPTSVRFLPNTKWKCNQPEAPLEDVSVEMGVATKKSYDEELMPPHHRTIEGSPITIQGEVSVGAVLTTRPINNEEEEEHETEEFGENNPAQLGKSKCLIGHPVNCATGNQVETQTDLSVGGRGLGLSFTRTYNSQLARKQFAPEPNGFGFGWTHSYSAHIEFSTYCRLIHCGQQRATIHQDNGSTITFSDIPGSAEWRPRNPLTQARLVTTESGYTYTLPSQEKMYFDNMGRLISEADRDGNTLTMTYASARLTAVTDSAGRKLTFAYNEGGQVESVKDQMGHTVKYAYEGQTLKSVTQPAEVALRWQFKYDANHQLTSETDGRGHTVTTEYLGFFVASQTDAMARKRKWQYSEIAGGSETIVTEPNGAVTREQFNRAGLPISVTRASGTASAATTTYEYNLADELVAATDPDKHTIHYGYDTLGNRTSEKDANGNETKWTYDSTHDVETITAPGGETTTIKREAHGNPEVVERPAPESKIQKTTYKYDIQGDVESITDPLEHARKYEYDTYGDRKSETDPEGNKRTWEYNEDSQAIATVSPRGNVTGGKPAEYTTKIERDPQGRALTVTDPLGHKTKYTYDGDGNVETSTDGNSNKTKYTYDADNELTKTEEPKGTATETGYDAAGQATSQTDGNKHITKYVRNLLEEVTEVVDPREHKTTKEYDAAGNLKTLTDPAKHTATYTYDPGNRLKEVSYSDGKTPAVEYEYNKDGKITLIKDGTGTSKYSYDQLDRRTEAETGHKEVAKYEYNLANEQTKVTYPNTKSITSTFDKDGRMETVTDWLTHVTKFSYDPDSDLGTTTFPTETKNEDKYVYNNADQITEVKMLKAAETLASLVYTRDSDGQVKGATSKGLPGEEKPAFEYDANSRLTKGAGVAYEYDAANDPTKIASSTYKYDASSELESSTGFKYTYNETGQRTKLTPTTGAATTYGYDETGNLTSVERPKEGATAEIKDSYTYNGEGLRASQTISATTSYLAWDTNESLPLLLSDATNNYIYGPNGLPIEQISSGGTPTYLHHDQQGSTRLLTGSAGTVTGKCTYGAYGTPTCEGTTTTPLGYDAQYTSSDTGLIYMRARVYDPSTAQFLTVDPVVPFTRASYNYARDNPLNFTDAAGLEAIPLPAPVAGGCAAAPEICGAAAVGGVDAWLGAKVFNAWAGEESGNDEGEEFLKQKEAERENCGDPAQPPGEGWVWKGKGEPGSEEGSWFNEATREYLHPDFKPSAHGPHYDYRGGDGTEYRIYPDGRIEPKP